LAHGPNPFNAALYHILEKAEQLLSCIYGNLDNRSSQLQIKPMAFTVKRKVRTRSAVIVSSKILGCDSIGEADRHHSFPMVGRHPH